MKAAILCAWCGKLLSSGALPASHGICTACEEIVNAELETLISQGAGQ